MTSHGSAIFLLVALVTNGVLAQQLKPPVFTLPERKETLYFKDRSEVSVDCHANGTPPPTYSWWRNDKPLKPTDKVKINRKTGQLSFPSYTLDYDGHYMCVATSEYITPHGIVLKASSFSQVQFLRQNRMGSFSRLDKHIEAQEYSYQILSCNMTSQSVGQDITYKWYFSKQSEQLNDFDNGRIYIDTNGNLYFTYVKDTDQRISDKAYMCGIGSTMAGKIALGDSNFLTVLKSDVVDIPLRLMDSNSGLQVKKYSNATLECVFGGFDPSSPGPPHITWINNNDETIDGGPRDTKYDISSYRRRLTIHLASKDDEGDFKCQVGNLPQHKVTLDVVSVPYFDGDNNQPMDQTVPEKGDAVFHCNAKSMPGDPEPSSPMWYINGQLMDNSFSHQKYVKSDDRKTLTIKDVKKPDDISCIQCMVKNNIGTTWANGCLTVVADIDITRQPLKLQKVVKGDIVNFTVRAKSDSKITYFWTFKNETLINTLPPYVLSDINRDYINTSLLSNEEYQFIAGVYKVRMTNGIQNKFLTFEVELVDKPQPILPVVKSADFPMWIIFVIVSILFLLLVLLIVVCVICRKKQEGDYNVDKKETGAGLDPKKELMSKGFDDFSRPDYDEYDYPERPRRDIPFDDDPIRMEDGEPSEDETFFNEDGSFIGQYQKKDPSGLPRPPNESNI